MERNVNNKWENLKTEDKDIWIKRLRAKLLFCSQSYKDNKFDEFDDEQINFF